jgi:hypothetical protein
VTRSALLALAFPLVAAAAGGGCTAAGTNHPSEVGAAGTTGTGSGGSPAGTAGTGAPAGSAGTNGAAGTVGAGGGGGRTCGLQMFSLERKPAEVLLLLDRSASMQDPPDSTTTTPKWDLVLAAVKQVVMDTNMAVSWGLKVFPEGTGDACVAGSVTSKIDVPIAPDNATNVINAIDATTDAGNGTPTGDAENAAVAYLQTLTDSNPKYVLLATDGEPSCAAIPTSESTSNARPYAVTAVTNAATAGFDTFVVGVATTKSSDTSTLNMLADAGKVPVDDPRPLANHFYLGSTQAQLTTALQVITGQVSSCVFPLNPPPPVLNDPNKLGVYFTSSDMKIPYDASMTNGWAYTDTNDTAVKVYGMWCDMIENAGDNMVKIIYGCPTIDVP